MTLKENQIQADNHTLEATYGKRNPRLHGETDEEYHNRLNTGRSVPASQVDAQNRLPHESETDFTNRVGKPGVRAKGETEAQYQARVKSDASARDHPSLPARNEVDRTSDRALRTNEENRA